MTDVACVIIAGGKRGELLDTQVIPSVLAQPFSEVVVVGEHHAGQGYRYLHIPKLLGTTTDALVKRDAGTAATRSPLILYLCDDHAFRGGLHGIKMDAQVTAWDALVPQRYARHPEQGLVRIPNGEEGGYCGGHAGLFRRRVIEDRPWSAQPHHRLWDLYSSRNHQQAGFIYLWNTPLMIEDLEVEACPWN